MSDNGDIGGVQLVENCAPSKIRCSSCGKLLSPARLQAKPNATQCVPCLEAAGDVPIIRRYDEVNHETTHQTYYTHNLELDIARQRSLKVVPPDAAFFAAVGDDSDLTVDRYTPDIEDLIPEDITIVGEEEYEN